MLHEPMSPEPATDDTRAHCETGQNAAEAQLGFSLVRHRFGSDRTDLECWVAAPKNGIVTGAPIVAVHGITRDAREQAKLLAPACCAAGRAVIAPHFRKRPWPSYQRLVAGQRADLALIKLLTAPALAAFGLSADLRFHLFGYSGGAQFAHRFALLYPGRARSLTIASAGWYTFFDDEPFPYGLGEQTNRNSADWGGRMRDNLPAFLTIPTLVAIGGRDCVVDKNTRSGPRIDRQQGRSRIARARNWSRAMAVASRAAGVEANVRFEVLTGCGHSFGECVRAGGLDHLVAEAANAAESGAEA
ncbi:MAG: hypothetical protein AAFX08_06375 [Pseudomonadota bacterium]